MALSWKEPISRFVHPNYREKKSNFFLVHNLIPRPITELFRAGEKTMDK